MITELTRQSIIDELSIRGISWSGRLSEVDFLSRLYRLETLPSTDPRYKDMAGDIYQHRINNPEDWEDLWVFNDTRLELDQDDKFLSFLAETIHPVVRTETEVTELLTIYNNYLRKDGYELVVKSHISGRPVYAHRKTGGIIEVDAVLESKQAYRLLAKAKQKLETDLEGSIDNSRAAIESAIAEIYTTITGEEFGNGGSLADSFKRIKDLLALTENRFTNEHIKATLRSLVGLIVGLDGMSNEMGDRHTRPTKPEKRHAQLCFNSAVTLVDFLYNTLEYRFENGISLFDKLIQILDTGNNRLLTGPDLLNEPQIKKLLLSFDANIKNILKQRFIHEYEINNFRQSDVFFTAMELLIGSLTQSDIDQIIKRHENNSQACGLVVFRKLIKKNRPDLNI
jgi:hypothetical protein